MEKVQNGDSDASEQKLSSERPKDVYVTEIHLPPRRGSSAPEKVILSHNSLAAVAEYLCFNNYIVGEPAPYTAYARVETYDGKPLNEDELAYLANNGVSRADYTRKSYPKLSAVPDHILNDPNAYFLPELDLPSNGVPGRDQGGRLGQISTAYSILGQWESEE